MELGEFVVNLLLFALGLFNLVYLDVVWNLSTLHVSRFRSGHTAQRLRVPTKQADCFVNWVINSGGSRDPMTVCRRVR